MTATISTAGVIGRARQAAVVTAYLRRARQWRYDGGKRDLRLDLMRGAAVVAMVADHVGGERSWFYTITGGDRFFVSAAEAFVFLSGLLLGMVNAGLIRRGGIDEALTRALKRAAVLYLLTVGLTLATAAIALMLGLPWSPRMTAGGFTDWMVGILTLHRTYYMTDVLLLYTLLLLLAGPALLLLEHERTGLVLGLSWTLWGLWQLWPQYAQTPWPIIGNDLFNLSAWQVLFINGLVIGYHRRAIEARFAGVSRLLIMSVSGLLFVGAIVLYRLQFAPLARVTDPAMVASRLFAKHDVDLGRLLVFAPFMIFMYGFLTLAWRPVRRLFGGLLLPLGQHALGAYMAHLFVVAFLTRLNMSIPGADMRSALQNTLMQAIGIALVWGVIRLREPLAALAGKAVERGESPPGALTHLARSLGWEPAPAVVRPAPVTDTARLDRAAE